MAGLELDLNVEQWAFGVGRDQVAELPPGWLFHVRSTKCKMARGSVPHFPGFGDFCGFGLP